MHHPINRLVYITAFVIPLVGHLLERELAQLGRHERSIQRLAALRTAGKSGMSL